MDMKLKASDGLYQTGKVNKNPASDKAGMKQLNAVKSSDSLYCSGVKSGNKDATKPSGGMDNKNDSLYTKGK